MLSTELITNMPGVVMGIENREQNDVCAQNTKLEQRVTQTHMGLRVERDGGNRSTHERLFHHRVVLGDPHNTQSPVLRSRTSGQIPRTVLALLHLHIYFSRASHGRKAAGGAVSA